MDKSDILLKDRETTSIVEDKNRIAELEAFVLQVRNFYFDHHNITPPPLARGADHSSPSCTWARGAWFEMESRRLLQKSPAST